MIEVNGLHKDYGGAPAVEGVSFSVGTGEIVGFLGPNGAGKTTTLRILAGYLPQSSGTAKILGLDNIQDSLEIRRQVGYLQENNPLYESMEVSEYLGFLWKARSLGSSEEMDRRFRELIPSCGLADVLGKEIGELSKGYRQRVGLAAAILHDPKILLLDEPTSGLDPIQAREVRDLIKSFKEKKTIMISTHILTEAHFLCDRVMIIHHGRLVTDRPMNQLSEGLEYTITVSFERGLSNGDAFSGVDGVTGLEGPSTAVSGGEVTYRIRAKSDIRRRLFEWAASKRAPMVELKMERQSLEEIFHELTK